MDPNMDVMAISSRLLNKLGFKATKSKQSVKLATIGSDTHSVGTVALSWRPTQGKIFHRHDFYVFSNDRFDIIFSHQFIIDNEIIPHYFLGNLFVDQEIKKETTSKLRVSSLGVISDVLTHL
jgi:hypothetical protein